MIYDGYVFVALKCYDYVINNMDNKIMRYFPFLAILNVCCLSPTQAMAQQLITTPILPTLQNFRDIAGISVSNGGTGFVNPTANNGVMRAGVFYRSNAPSYQNSSPSPPFSQNDLATMSRLGISKIIDLRTSGEILLAPDVTLTGASYININILGVPNKPIKPENSAPLAAVVSFYKSEYYVPFVTSPVMRSGFHDVLSDLAQSSGASLFHCKSGKDRTGWTAVLLQSIAGVPLEIIKQDYVATNSYLAATIDTAKSLETNPAFYPSLEARTGVLPEYLQFSLDQVTSSYGTMYNYLTQGLGLTQTDIYVLRAKMVKYLTLPGQAGLTGNAAAGAALLNALQDSPLSGRDTKYNYYLQSAIGSSALGGPAGNGLGGVEEQIGGQVHADVVSYLLRHSQWLDTAIVPYTNNQNLNSGQNQLWLTGYGGNFTTKACNDAAKASEHNVGSLVGVTHRINQQALINTGIGYDWGSINSAGANGTVNTLLAMLGGRYGFTTTETGPFIAGRVDAGWVNYNSERFLSAGLGSANGRSSGIVYDGLAGFGNIIQLTSFTITPQAGFRMTGVSLGSFNETGSELALNVKDNKKLLSSILVSLDINLNPKQLKTWIISPTATLGYEQILNNPQAASIGTLYDLTIGQNSAYNSGNLMKAGLGVMAKSGAFTSKLDGNIIGSSANSLGFNGRITFGYSL